MTAGIIVGSQGEQAARKLAGGSHTDRASRAVAVQASGLTAKATSRRFNRGATGAVTEAAKTLVGRDILVKVGSGYDFDNLYQRGCVASNALPDLGINLPPTHMPGRSDL